MKKEETYIRQKCGSRTSFRVPDGYFENFTRQLMEQLPEKEPRPGVTPVPVIGRRRKTGWYAAACACGIALLSGGIYLATQLSSLHTTATAESTVASENTNKEVSEEYFYDALDYVMMDNQEIAMYLTEAH